MLLLAVAGVLLLSHATIRAQQPQAPGDISMQGVLTAVWGDPQAVTVVGSAPVFSSARLHKFRLVTHPGAVWTHAQGVLVNVQPDGDGVTL